MVLVGALAACGAPAGPVAVTGVTFNRADAGGKAGEVVTSFKAGDRTLMAEAKLNQVVTDFKGRAVWTLVESTTEKDVEIAEAELAGPKTDTLNTQITGKADWPAGKYKVDFYQGSALLKSQPFTVQ